MLRSSGHREITMSNITGSCACGQSKFTLSHLPTQRLRCHCTICQSVYDGPYSDFLLVNAKTVEIDPTAKISYSQHKKPPALDRGLCTSCEKPVIGTMSLMPGVKLAFIPAYTLRKTKNLPEPSRHIWYQSRRADIDDDLPKHEGILRSNLACLGPFFKGFRGK